MRFLFGFSHQSALKLFMNYSRAPAFSLTKSPKKSIVQMPHQDYVSPGPIYNTTDLGIKQKSVSHSIGKSGRTKINHWIENTPAPTHYQPIKAVKNTHKTVPKSERLNTVNENPDPTWYQPEHTLAKPTVLNYSLGSRYPSIMDSVNAHPGPGHYENTQSLSILNKSKLKKQSLFGTATRFRSTIEYSAPGVGSYEVKTNLLQHKLSIGKEKRNSKPIEDLPGPANYHKKSFCEENLKRKLGKSISGRFKNCFESVDVTSQAFIKYFENPQQKPFINSSKEYSIGKAPREPIKSMEMPGPSDYVNNNFATKNNINATIPQAHAEDYNGVIHNPGPGTYKPNMDKGRQYSFPRSKSLQIVHEHPGVGRYNVQTHINQPKSNAFSKSARTNFISKNTAGVGDYSINQQGNFKGTISKAERFKKTLFTNPGPGDYHVHPIMGYKSQRE